MNKVINEAIDYAEREGRDYTLTIELRDQLTLDEVSHGSKRDYSLYRNGERIFVNPDTVLYVTVQFHGADLSRPETG